MDKLQAYLNNGETGMYLLLGGGLVLLFFLRNPLKALFANFAGYRANIDDYAMSVHKNYDVIMQNDLAILKSGINLKSALLIVASLPAMLINPLLFAVVYGVFFFENAKIKLSKLKDFTIFDDFKTDDEFVNFLNNKSAKLNLLVDEIMIGGYIFLGVGLYSNSYILAVTGIAMIAVVMFATVLMIYNAYMYKVNYKYVEFFRVMRLLEASSLGGKKSLLVLAGLSLYSNMTTLAGISVFVWIIFALRFFVNMTIKKILKKEDDVSEEHKQIENREYVKIENVASYPNPISQSRGYKFTTALQMKFFELEQEDSGKDLIHLDNYAFYPQTVNRTDLRKNPLLRKSLTENVKVSLNTLEFTKQLMILGGMGSGKTVLLKHIIEQVIKSDFKKFKAIAYNDTKGDFSQDFYRDGKDILINLFDKRATVWCPFLEMDYNIEAGESFISNLFTSLQGDDKDFFMASAKQKTSEWLKESYFNTDDNISAWNMFFEKIKEYEKEIKDTDDKTKSSILATIEIALDILKIMHYQIVEEKRKTFTFFEFVNSQDIQLFFVNNKRFESKLTPYLNGLTATYINTVMSKNDTKEHLILNVFDEFLTMKIDEATRKTLLTATRSKGFCNLLVAQYLINNEKLIQDLDSSRYALITFNINDDFTLEKVMKKIGKTEHLTLSSSPVQEQNTGGNTGQGHHIAGAVTIPLTVLMGGLNALKNKKNINYSLGNAEVLLEQQLQSMPKYHHLTFIPSEEVKSITDTKRFFKLMLFGYENLMKNISNESEFLAKESGIMYLGYTPFSNFSYKNNSFEEWNMRDYYTFNQIRQKEKNRVFEDEKEEFIHYMKIKFAGNVEEAEEYIKENGLESYDIAKMFERVEENGEKIQKLISKYSEQQRYDIMNEFFEINSEDLDAKYEFVKERDLIGCILGIFTFSDEFQESILNGKNDVEQIDRSATVEDKALGDKDTANDFDDTDDYKMDESNVI